MERLRQLIEERDRRRRRRHFLEYVLHTRPGYLVAPHHREIAEKLEAVERGDIKRLMIVMPPRHGKSLLVSERFPCWFLGRNPDKQVVSATYSGELSRGFGRRVRNTMLGGPHLSVFPDVALSSDSKASHLFHIQDRGGVYLAASVDGALTGFGGDLIIADDVLKGQEAANSAYMRDKLWDWWTHDLYTRLAPNGAVIVVNTRWHLDDISGRLLEKADQGGEQWELLHYPALGPDGEALWPERYSRDALENIRRAVGDYAFASLYQGQPVRDEGAYFKREWIHEYDVSLIDDYLRGHGREYMRFYIASDYAITDGAGDYTVHTVFGVDPQENIYVVDMYRGQSDPATWVQELIRLIKHYRPDYVFEEKGGIIKAVGPFLSRELRRQRVPANRHQFVSAAAKDHRARAIQGAIQLNGLYVPRNRSWSALLVSEMLDFPRGTHDDMVDTLSLFGRGLRWMRGGKEETEEHSAYEFPVTDQGVRMDQMHRAGGAHAQGL